MRISYNIKNISGNIDKYLDVNVLKIFDIKNSMNLKTSFGGTAEKNVKKMIKKYKKEII